MFDFTTIEKGSHYVAIRKPTPAIIKVLYKLGGEFTQFGHVTENRRKKWAPIKTFVVYSHHGREFRLHIGQFDRFMELMRQNYVPVESYEIIDRVLLEGDDIEVEIQEKFQLRGQQPEAVEFADQSGPNPLLKIPMGEGKAQPLDSPIRVPGGWIKMGELKIGSEIAAWDGSITKVTQIFPQGKLKVYTVTFSDGRTAQCCQDHLWKVTCSDWGEYGEETRVVMTSSLLKIMSSKHFKGNIYVDLYIPGEDIEREYSTDPYLLGILMGRANVSEVANASMTEYLLPGMDARDRKDLYIPEEYLEGSTRQRYELIRGIITPGANVLEGGVISFDTLSSKLANNVTYLARSLGGLAKTTSRPSDGGFLHTVRIQHPWPSMLLRDHIRQVHADTVTSKGRALRLRIDEIRLTGYRECQCISIDHPDSLYVTEDFVVTHNTFMSLYTAAKRKKRMAVVILAGYIDKWVGDLQKTTDIKLSEICVVQGSDGLARSSHYPGSGLPMPKAFVISLNSMRSWLKNHEEQAGNDLLPGFACLPDQYFESLGIGTVIFDEIHQHPHAVFKIFTYTHVSKTVSLTATLETKDPVLRKVQSTMYPKSARFDKIRMKQYIDVVACNYQIVNLAATRIRTTEHGSNSYSQTAFENSIISDRVVYPQYVKMTMDLIQEVFINKRKVGDKLIFFTGTKEMSRRLQAQSKRLWPDLDIRTYLEGDDFENVIVADIRFTTVISGGTAIDIPQLTTAIMSNSIDSPNAILQALGRLREIPGRETIFYYLYSPTLKKQKDYHESRKDLFAGKVKSYGEKMLPAIYAEQPSYLKLQNPHGR